MGMCKERLGREVPGRGRNGWNAAMTTAVVVLAAWWMIKVGVNLTCKFLSPLLLPKQQLVSSNRWDLDSSTEKIRDFEKHTQLHLSSVENTVIGRLLARDVLVVVGQDVQEDTAKLVRRAYGVSVDILAIRRIGFLRPTAERVGLNPS